MEMQAAGLARFKNDDRFTNLRQTGTIAAMDINVKDHGYLSDIGPRLYAFFQKKNLLLRPLGNTLYSMPPYCVTQEDINLIYDAIAEAADELL